VNCCQPLQRQDFAVFTAGGAAWCSLALARRHDDMLAYVEGLYADGTAQPDTRTYQLLLDSAERNGAGAEVAAAIRASMASHGVAPPTFERYS
jgi:hypothetical protein